MSKNTVLFMKPKKHVLNSETAKSKENAPNTVTPKLKVVILVYPAWLTQYVPEKTKRQEK